MTDFDDFLRSAFAAGVGDTSVPTEDEDAQLPVPAHLAARVSRRATNHSSRLLAALIQRGGEQRGLDVEGLVRNSGPHRDRVASFLRRGGDPRAIPSSVLARLLYDVRLRETAWRGLLTQAVISHAIGSTPSAAPVWGRTTGLTSSERLHALHDRDLDRDVDVAEERATRFVEEVVRSWTTLRDSGTTSG